MMRPLQYGNFDFTEEHKEYSLLCQGKSEKYRFYTDWEDHVKSQLETFQTPKDLYNFKRYCKNCERAASQIPTVYWAYVALMIPMVLDFVLIDIPNLFKVSWSVGILIYVIIENRKVVRESFFFTDIIEIIEAIEEEKSCERGQ